MFIKSVLYNVLFSRRLNKYRKILIKTLACIRISAIIN